MAATATDDATVPSAASGGDGGSEKPVLLILRGPAGAGKSTVAADVAARLRGDHGRLVALVEEDHVRIAMLAGAKKGSDGRAARVALQSGLVLAALEAGVSVVLEGILNAKHEENRAMLQRLCDAAGEGRFGVWYFDVSLEETKRRHATRAKSSEFGPEKLDKWFASAQPWGHAEEGILPETLSKDQLVDVIAAKAEKQLSEHDA